jgi:hypothetical protein
MGRLGRALLESWAFDAILGVTAPSGYLDLMRFVSMCLGCAAFVLAGCAGGGQSGGQPTVGRAEATLISYDEAMQEPVAIGDATEECPERQLSGDQIVVEMDSHLDEMYRQCVVSEARRGRVPSTVTIDIAILGAGRNRLPRKQAFAGLHWGHRRGYPIPEVHRASHGRPLSVPHELSSFHSAQVT